MGEGRKAFCVQAASAVTSVCRGTLATDLLPGQWGGHTTHAWTLGTVLGALHKLTHLIFTITLGDSYSSEDKCTSV